MEMKRTTQYKAGEEWACANTKLLHPSSTSSPSNSTLSPKVFLAVRKQTKEFIAKNSEFKPDYFKLLTEDATTAATTTLSSSSSSDKKKQAKTTFNQ
eukprot:15000968-Ditylum_brightwellii.AAC.1